MAFHNGDRSERLLGELWLKSQAGCDDHLKPIFADDSEWFIKMSLKSS
jgi:hypothetical protein